MNASNPLNQFIADLAVNPNKIRRFQADASKEATAAGLSQEEIAVLETNDFGVIFDYMRGGDDRPMGSEEEGGGG